MPITSLKPVLEYSLEHKTAHGAFNVNMIAQAQAVITAHELMRSCAIIQCADPANAFMGGRSDFLNGTDADRKLGAQRISRAVNDMAAKSAIPVVLHLDHGKTFLSCVNAIEAGFSSVMIDGSSLPFQQNVELTREVVKFAHARGVSVEGELGILAGVEDDVFSQNSTYTNPVKVVEFVKSTGCDALAISYGTKHGANKGSNVQLRGEICIASMENLRHENLMCALVSHGSSFVPSYVVEEINELGGTISGSGGVPVEQLRSVIPTGITKINMDTDIRLATTRNIRKWLNGKNITDKTLLEIKNLLDANPAQFDPRYYLTPIMDALIKGEEIDAAWYPTIKELIQKGVEEIVYNAICSFGCIGDARKVQSLSLEQLAKEYK